MNRSELSATGESQGFDPFIGEVLSDRYRADACIGRGGMGIVYRGTHLSLGKRIAIKRLDARLANDPSAFERFRREAVAASRIESPHVVQVFDWGKSADGSPFIVMELLEGQNLRGYFEDEGRLLPQEAARITAQVLKGLHRIHQSQILHRDLKPENVFLCRYDPEPPFVKLLDFGISKQLAPDAVTRGATQTGVVLGTATYMSPEQAKGDQPLDVRSDLYSLGAVLFEALTGLPPHNGRTYEATLIDICTRDADDVRLHCPLISEPLARVIKKALAKNREERFASSTEFLDALLLAVPELGADSRGLSSGEISHLPTLPVRPSRNPEDGARTALPTNGLTDDASPSVGIAEAASVRRAGPSRLGHRRQATLAGLALAALLLPFGFWLVRNNRSNTLSYVPSESHGKVSTLSAPSTPPNARTALAENGQDQNQHAKTVGAGPPSASGGVQETNRLVAAGATASPLSSVPTSSTVKKRATTNAPIAADAQQPPTAGVAGGLKLRRSMP